MFSFSFSGLIGERVDASHHNKLADKCARPVQAVAGRCNEDANQFFKIILVQAVQGRCSHIYYLSWKCWRRCQHINNIVQTVAGMCPHKMIIIYVSL